MTPLSKPDVEPCDLTAVAARRAIAMGRLDPVDLLESCIARIAAENPSLNAIVAGDFEAARDAAQRAARRASTAPLHGLPIAVKDLTDTAGLRTTYGSLRFANHLPRADAPLVARLKRAGAIVLGKTNTPEFGAGANTVNSIYGSTGNPRNPHLSPGGSSGGSAAAVAAGMVPLATGSDLGGSLRIPAAFCGVVGMRPSAGGVADPQRTLPFSPLWTDGPIARNVADAALMLNAMRAPDPADPLVWPDEPHDSPSPAVLGDLCAVFSEDLGILPVDPRVRAGFGATWEALAPCFGHVRASDVDFSGARFAFQVLRAKEFLAAFDEMRHQPDPPLSDNILANLAAGDGFSLADGAKAEAIQGRLFRAFLRIFEHADLFICPVTAVPPFPRGGPIPDVIEGQKLETYFDWFAMTWIFSLLGVPCLSMPMPAVVEGAPLGLQIICAPRQDRRLLQIACAIEASLANIPPVYI